MSFRDRNRRHPTYRARLTRSAIALSVVVAALAVAASAVGASADAPEPTAVTAASVPPTEWQMVAVSCPTTHACIAVGWLEHNRDRQGKNGLPISTEVNIAARWSHGHWRRMRIPSPSKLVQMSAISCWSTRGCMAVGEYFKGSDGLALAERWNGHKWSVQHAVDQPSATELRELDSVSCVSAHSCTAVGDYLGAGTKTKTLIEHWNGIRWLRQRSPSRRYVSQLSSVACTEVDACVAVGSEANGASNRSWPLIERWDGSNWRIRHAPLPTGKVVNGVANSVACTAANSCIAVGSFNRSMQIGEPVPTWPLAERWNGRRWRLLHPKPGPNPSSTELDVVACPSMSGCLTFGYSYDNPKQFATTAQGVAERYGDGTWRPLTPPSDLEWPSLAVSCPARGVCTAIVSPSVASRLSGGHWRVQHLPTQ